MTDSGTTILLDELSLLFPVSVQTWNVSFLPVVICYSNVCVCRGQRNACWSWFSLSLYHVTLGVQSQGMRLDEPSEQSRKAKYLKTDGIFKKLVQSKKMHIKFLACLL